MLPPLVAGCAAMEVVALVTDWLKALEVLPR
jgi:hypothetical protein